MRKCSSCSMRAAKSAPKLVEELVPRVLPLASLVRVLQGLLAERVPLRNMRTILETLAEHAPRTQDPAVLQGQVRIALGRQIVADIAGAAPEIPVMSLDAELERLLSSALDRRGGHRARARTCREAAAAPVRVHAAPRARRRAGGAAGRPAAALGPGRLRPRQRPRAARARVERDT